MTGTGILEIQLMPVPYPEDDTDLFDTVNIRITRFSNKDLKIGQSLNAREVLRVLCTYLLAGEDCNHVKEVRPVLLDGDTSP